MRPEKLKKKLKEVKKNQPIVESIQMTEIAGNYFFYKIS